MSFGNAGVIQTPSSFLTPLILCFNVSSIISARSFFSCSFLALPLLGLLIYLIVRIRDNKPIIRKIKVEPKLPPHQAAMKEIERIKIEKVWQKGRSKEDYTE